MRKLFIGCVVFFLFLSTCNNDSADTLMVIDVATPFERPEYVPSASDVTMRTLRFRPRSDNENSQHNTFQALDDFHANRLEWTYLQFTDEEIGKIQRVKESGRLFGGASGSSSGTYVKWHSDGTATKKYVILDINGNPVIKGHQKYWDRPGTPGCVNNPEYREGYLKYLKRYVDAGVDAMQRDEPSYSHNWAKMGTGCFCDHCTEKFNTFLNSSLSEEELDSIGIQNVEPFNYKEYIKSRGYDMGVAEDFDWSDRNDMSTIIKDEPLAKLFADFQRDATVDFYKWIMAETDKYAGKHIIFSCNNTSFQRWEEPYFELFDFAISELMLSSANPVHIYDRAQKARELNKVQVFGSPKTLGEEYPEEWLTRLRRNVISTSYASGGLSRVPWDIFEQTRDGQGRYFGEPEDYADLYGFVRANHEYLDGYCTAGAFGKGIEDHRFGQVLPVIKAEDKDSLYVFLRAKPHDKNSAVVIHLVDWNTRTSESRLKLRTSAFTRDGKLQVRLMVPKEYNYEIHKEAEEKAQKMRHDGEKLGPQQAEAYKDLVLSEELAIEREGDFSIISVPALHPWGFLVIEP